MDAGRSGLCRGVGSRKLLEGAGLGMAGMGAGAENDDRANCCGGLTGGASRAGE